MMGNGNWATSTTYAPKVPAIWRQMLAWNGLPAPPRQPVPGAAPRGPLLVRTSAPGAGSLAGWRLRRETLAGGIARLGAPASRTPGGGGCLARWPAVLAAILLTAGGDPCESDAAAVRWARVSSPIWRTQRGLAPGDTFGSCGRSTRGRASAPAAGGWSPADARAPRRPA